MKKTDRQLLELLNAYPRKDIRYAMFRKRAKKIENQSLDGVDAALLKLISQYYPRQEGFTGWDKFAEDWDIGIDDVFTMSVRREKWWLYGLPKTMLVVKGHRVESKEEGIIHFDSLGLVDYVGEGDTKQPMLQYNEILSFMEPQRIRHFQNSKTEI